MDDRGKGWCASFCRSFVAAVLALFIAAGASSATSEAPDVEELIARSMAAGRSAERFYAAWRMTMAAEPGPALPPGGGPIALEPFVMEIHLWRDGDAYRHEAHMPEELLAEASMQTLTPMGGPPACLVAVAPPGDDRLYCQGMDGGWNVLDGTEWDDFVNDAPFLDDTTLQGLELHRLTVRGDEWNGRSAWRVDGVLDAARSVDLDLDFDDGNDALAALSEIVVTYWVDPSSYVLLASDARIEFPEELLQGVLAGFTMRMELIEYEVDGPMDAALFAPPSGLTLP